MHWLPLVAMVIASALPFPHDPVSRIAAATTEPGFDNRRERRHDQQAARLADHTVDNNVHGNVSYMDYNMADALSQQTRTHNLQNSENYVKSEGEETLENRRTFRSNSGGGDEVSLFVPSGDETLRIEKNPSDNPLRLNDSDSSKQSNLTFSELSKKDNLQDSTQRLSRFSTPTSQSDISPVLQSKSQPGPEPTASTGNQRTTVSEDSIPDLGLSLGNGLDFEGDEMYLDAHPRVLFSPSPSPPEHPPLLLMLETGLLEEDRDREDQEDLDGHIEGHGDRALDRTADSPRVTADVVRAVKRDKRSHLMDRRRGERSVCESESVWITDKTSAIDSHGHRVTVLQEIQTQTGPLKQYFYETRCRQAEQQSSISRSRGAAGKPAGTGVAGAGCLGVDKKQWVSECKAKQSFVRALTRDANNRTGWRWIRIDSSCVCVLLSRTNQALAKEASTRKGRG